MLSKSRNIDSDGQYLKQFQFSFFSVSIQYQLRFCTLLSFSKLTHTPLQCPHTRVSENMLPGVTLSENMAGYKCIYTSTGIDSWYFLSSSWVFKEGSSRKEGQFIISKECLSLLSKYIISGSQTFSVMPPFRGQKIIILKPSV